MSVSVCEFKRLQPRASTNFLHAWLHLWLRHTASDIHFLLFITGVLNLRSVLDAHLRSCGGQQSDLLSAHGHL